MPPKKDRCKAPSEAKRASAEEMAEYVYGLLEIWRGKPAEKVMGLANIAAALRQCRDEGYKDGLTQRAFDSKMEYLRGRFEALDEAAKIVLSYPLTERAHERIAKEIRALKTPETSIACKLAKREGGK